MGRAEVPDRPRGLYLGMRDFLDGSMPGDRYSHRVPNGLIGLVISSDTL